MVHLKSPNIINRKESVNEKQTGCFYNGFYNYNL